MLKGLAIIAVVLYHFGVVKSGYLGVDVFLVVNGFLVIPSICSAISDKSFNYCSFIKKRVIRLYPVLLIACIVCLIIGYTGMLPDDYENLSEQTFASSVFANNVLQAITTNNYWNVVNDFKPLMHTWYLGVLVQFYLLFPILLVGYSRVIGKRYKLNDKWLKLFFFVTGGVSLVLFLLPFWDSGSKFYYVPFRYYEFVLGGYIALFPALTNNVDSQRRSRHFIAHILLGLIIILLFYGVVFVDADHLGGEVVPIGLTITSTNVLLLPNWFLVIISVLLSAAFISISNKRNVQFNNIFVSVGKRSYSIFIWHQIIVAFFRYFISYELNIKYILTLLVITILASESSYQLIEKRRLFIGKSKVLLLTCLLAVLICSFGVYWHAGVVRDVPELEVYKSNIHRNMHSDYCDRIYDFDKEFPDNNKINVLIVGSSFARDWGNILMESPYINKFNISYHYTFDKDILKRINNSDYIFTFMSKNDVPDYVWSAVPTNRVYGIGTKNFGESNGIIYSRRNHSDYYEQKIKLPEAYNELNNKWKEEWSDNYIDLLSYVTDDDNNVRVFSDNHLLLSQDCHHLTHGGAVFFASIIDFKKIFHDDI